MPRVFRQSTFATRHRNAFTRGIVLQVMTNFIHAVSDILIQDNLAAWFKKAVQVEIIVCEVKASGHGRIEITKLESNMALVSDDTAMVTNPFKKALKTTRNPKK